MRILSWNVLYRDRDARLELLAARAGAIEPDIILLQETSPEHASRLGAALGLELVAGGSELEIPGWTPSYSPAILVRPTMRAQPTGCLLAANGHDGGNRVFAAGAQVTPDDGRTLRIASVHLSSTRLAGRMGHDLSYRRSARLGDTAVVDDGAIRRSMMQRMDEIERLLEFISSPGADSAVIGGDFNFVPYGPEYRVLELAGFRDAWEAAPRLGSRDTILEDNLLLTDGVRVYSSQRPQIFPGSSGPLDYTLDFHFVRGSVDVGGAWTVGRAEGNQPWVSDHLGVVVEYEFPGAGTVTEHPRR